MIHVAFLKDAPLDAIVAGRKRFEFRLSFRRLACQRVREGDLLLLKRSGGEVESPARPQVRIVITKPSARGATSAVPCASSTERTTSATSGRLAGPAAG